MMGMIWGMGVLMTGALLVAAPAAAAPAHNNPWGSIPTCAEH
jgi:hypothetical protein